MRLFYNIFRAVIVTLLALIFLVPLAVYIVLSTDFAADKIREIAAEELSKTLGSEIVIDRVRIEPFNYVDIYGVTVRDDYGKTALTLENVKTRFEFWNFITTGHPCFDYIVVDGLRANLYKQTPDSPLNIAGIITHLQKDDKEKKPTKFDLSFSTVKIQNSELAYDILSAPVKTGVFDPNHLHLKNLNAALSIPELENDTILVKIRYLGFDEEAGLSLKNLLGSVQYTPQNISLHNLEIDLPNSRLVLGDYYFTIPDSKKLPDILNANTIELNIEPESYITPSDLASLNPVLNKLDQRFDISSHAKLCDGILNIENFDLKQNTDFLLKISGIVSNPFAIDSLKIKDLNAQLLSKSHFINLLKNHFDRKNSVALTHIINNLGYIDSRIELSGTPKALDAEINIESGAGSIDASTYISASHGFKEASIDGDIFFKDFNLGNLLDNPDFGSLTAKADGTLTLSNNKIHSADFNLGDSGFEFKDNLLQNISVQASYKPDRTFSISATSEIDGDGMFEIAVSGVYDANYPEFKGHVLLTNIDANKLGLIKKYPDYRLSSQLDFDLALRQNRNIDGFLTIGNTSFKSDNGEAKSLFIKNFSIKSDISERPNVIEIKSDFLNGLIEGEIDPASVFAQAFEILQPIFPALLNGGSVPKHSSKVNDFSFSFELSDNENLLNFFDSPIAVIYPVTIEGTFDHNLSEITFGIDAPYLMKGDMLIEQTSVEGKFEGKSNNGALYLTTQFPTKKGMMVLSGGINTINDLLRTHIDWEIQREKPVNGVLAFDTKFDRNPQTNELGIEVAFEQSVLNFGNDTWHFAPATIAYHPGAIAINDFAMTTESQSIKIDGKCEKSDPYSAIDIELKDVVLNTIFETLDINKALIGGIANGKLQAGGIFTETPFVTCDNLHVENIGYNNCVLGNGDIVANWDNDRKSFYLSAVISQEDGRKSYISGDIFPTTSSLDLSFVADRVKVGFMKPFMDAFAEDITGYASGKARIFGDFKYIDMEGDVFADDLGLKVGFTNTWYYATDSIHIVPGLIDIKNVTVRDSEGHKAKLNGYVKHNFFKDPVFDFRVTDAHDFLSYDVTPVLSPDWYGKIYGNGSAFITGSPGVVNIDVNMSTAENSTFTFVLSDTEEAEQYNFLTFRDKNRNLVTDTIIQKELLPPAVIEYRDRILQQALAQNPPSTYNMNIQMDITPAAKVIIVMDPIGGDEIKSWGRGNMRMTYTSIGNDLRMYGTYAIDRGTYNFTFQDIIVKDFVIREGSSITFTGDPYNASLDITASYVVNANLSDLDESFINDPDLTRTNVPVHALLLIKGDMRQPNINFDLEFPTLNSDIYRKVKSIISTEEMMNRQMIYLLALNRFYTPEYMSTTKGNELFSVASSTISSRLSNMLGKLSENWSISPNLRSDKGDFSDVQFDVALSSNLLNNRLRMNGNFGYRDKSLNTTQFIGDFDLEYLINRSGSWRLKAYNRFNDQTYFLRTAKTTQGVGIKFQREFDDMFGFLRRKKKNEDTVNKNDSIK